MFSSRKVTRFHTGQGRSVAFGPACAISRKILTSEQIQKRATSMVKLENSVTHRWLKEPGENLQLRWQNRRKRVMARDGHHKMWHVEAFQGEQGRGC